MPEDFRDSPKQVKKVRVAVWIGLSDKKCLEKLTGLNDCSLVESGILFRRYPVKSLKKFHQICPPPALRFSAVLSHLFALIVSIPWCLRFKPDVCVGISLSPHAVFAKIISIACRAKTINWFIGTDIYFRLNNSRWESIFKCLVKNASCTLTMGSRSTKLLATTGWDKRKILVGRNSYDFTNYHTGKNKIQWDVIYTGRLDRNKRIDLLLFAVSELRKFNPALKCAIAGEGPDHKRLERICNSLCLDLNVTFLGHQKDIPGLLSQSRILIMTSAWEGLPASVVEAFVMGLPVIAANVGDLSDLVVHNQNGILINSADPLDYAKAILRLLENDEEYDRMRFLAKRTGENMRKEMETGIPVVRWQHALEMALVRSCD